MNARILKSVGNVAGLLLLAGCVHAPLNKPLLAVARPTDAADLHPREEPRDDVIIALFFSGGGTRAASLSFGVLKALSAARVTASSGDYRLLDKVKVISAVSGGSFTAAYYCLYHDRIFTDFEDQFLKRDVNGALIRKVLYPLSWPRLGSPYYGRSDLAADYYDKILFHGATYADLGPNGGHPRLILNATDMANGEQFPFVQEHFDLIGSDLSSFKISRAVAAAAAFPLLLSPITLKNYRGTPGVADPELLRREAANGDPGRDLLVQSEFRSYGDSRENPFIHLIDGGTSDNLGLESLINADFRYGGMEHLIEETLHTQIPRRFVIVVVNASVRHKVVSSQSEAVPGIGNELWRLADNFEAHSDVQFLDLLRISLGRWRSEAAAMKKYGGESPEFYLISVDLTQFHGGPSSSFFGDIPTNFNLPSGTIDRLIAAGGDLLRGSPDYQRLLADLGATH